MPHPLEQKHQHTQTREQTLRDLQGKRGVFKRTAEVASFDIEARTVELAFSSEEAEVARWFGLEVLSHEDGACDLSRLNDSAALLVNHDTDDQVGVVVSARVDADRRGRSVVRFGKSVRANEVFQDVVDGIRKHVSVGYQVLDARLIEERDGVEVWSMTRWLPYEISIVAVPADPTVGVGRSAETAAQVAPATTTPPVSEERASETPAEVVEAAAETPVATRTTQPAIPATPRSSKVDENEIRAQAEAGVHERNKRFLEIGDKYGAQELARQFVGNPTATVEQLTAAILEQGAQRSTKPVSQTAVIGLSEREAQQFSFSKAIRALANPGDKKLQGEAAFEIEVSGETAKRSGKTASGILVPLDVMGAQRAAIPGYNLGGDGSTGNHLKATTLLVASFIDMLYNECIMMKYATPLTGLVGDIDIPKKTGKGQGYWVDEDESVGEALATFSKVSLAPRTVGAYSRVTRKMLLQSTPAIEQLIRADIAQALAQTIDSAALYGDGVKKPLGIFNTPGVNEVPFAGDFPTYKEVVAMETAVAAANAALGTLRYIGNANMRGELKTTQKFESTTGAPVWDGNSMNGYDAHMTNQVEAGDLLFGNLNDALVGFWGGLDITVDTVTLAKQGAHQIVALQDLDFIVRHAKSFAKGRKAASGG